MTGLALLGWLARSLLFWAAAIPTCAYAWRRGGQPERITALLIAIAIVATTIMPRSSYTVVVEPLLAIDALMLVGLMAVASVADRYWPLYFAAVQLLTVALHGVRAYDATILPTVYARMGGQLAYPTLAILAVGTWRHVRRGDTCDWSWQVSRERAGGSQPRRSDR